LRIAEAARHCRFVATFHVRRLPHYYAVTQPMFLTWRLQGSLPANRVFPETASSGRAFLALDRLLDGGRTGPLYLARPEVASLVVEAIRFREGALAHCRLHAWVVMANHVHLLITPLVAVSQIMQSLKRFTAREANRLLCLTGRAFWQEESFDRLVRHEAEFTRIVRYIEMNPVRAGLAETPGIFGDPARAPIDNRRAGCRPALQNAAAGLGADQGL
jgi:REP element-mobilizing transposase RayT